MCDVCVMCVMCDVCVMCVCVQGEVGSPGEMGPTGLPGEPGDIGLKVRKYYYTISLIKYITKNNYTILISFHTAELG